MVGRCGNRCDHDPTRPILLGINDPFPKGKGGFPLLLHKAIERTQTYFDRPGLLPSLNLANGSPRQQRSERREACIQVLSSILYRLNITTLCVGIPTTSGFVNLSVATLGKQTTLGEKRVDRALQDLKRSGILTISQPRCQKKDGTWMGQVAVKAVSRSLFKALGLETMLYMARKHAAKKHKEKGLQSPSKAAQGRMELFLKGLGDTLGKPPPLRRPVTRTASTKDPPKDDLADALAKIEAMQRKQAQQQKQPKD